MLNEIKRKEYATKKIIFYLHKNDDGNDKRRKKMGRRSKGRENVAKTIRHQQQQRSGSNVLTFMVIHFMKLKSEFGRNSISLLLYGYAINVIGLNALHGCTLCAEGIQQRTTQETSQPIIGNDT